MTRHWSGAPPASVRRHHRLLDGALMGGGLGDPLAHVAGTGAALGAGAAGPEDVGWAARPGAHGGVHFAFPDGPADTDIHRRFDPRSLQMRLTRKRKNRAQGRPRQVDLKPWQ